MSWTEKLDALGRMILDDGYPDHGVTVIIRTNEMISWKELYSLGISGVKTIGVGHVPCVETLEKIANLEYVREIQIAHATYPDQVVS